MGGALLVGCLRIPLARAILKAPPGIFVILFVSGIPGVRFGRLRLEQVGDWGFNPTEMGRVGATVHDQF